MKIGRKNISGNAGIVKEILSLFFDDKVIIIIATTISSCLFFACKPDTSRGIKEKSTSFSKRDEMILNYVINPLLDSNRYFFTKRIPLPLSEFKPTIDIGLIISDTLDAVENYMPSKRILLSDLKIDSLYLAININKSEKHVLVKFSRVCFIDKVTAFFYVSFYRDPDFAKGYKVTVEKIKNNWEIKRIEGLWIS